MNILSSLDPMDDAWPKRLAFAERLKEYQSKTGKTQAQAAGDLGLALSSLRQVLYQKSRKASFDTCWKAAEVFGCSVLEFVDDPGAKPSGVDLPDATPIQRFWFEKAIQTLGDTELDDDDRRILFEDLIRDAERRKADKRKKSPK